MQPGVETLLTTLRGLGIVVVVRRTIVFVAAFAAVLLFGTAAVVAAPGAPGEPSPGNGMPPFLAEGAELPPGLAAYAGAHDGMLPPGLQKKLDGEWLPPGQAKKLDGDWVPPGRAGRDGESTEAGEAEDEHIPPGQAKGEGWLPPGLAKKDGWLPPGLARKGWIPPGWRWAD
jgi:hypothetical protein